MSGRATGKVAVVTGSTRGIGEGIVRRLAAEGAKVVVSGIEDDAGERLAKEIGAAGGKAHYVRADVACPDDCAGLIAATQMHFGRVDVLVNNAGLFPSLTLEDSTAEAWDSVFAVNTRGAFLCSRAAIAAMQKQGGGSIVNIGTTLAYRGESDRFIYAASKGALLTLTRNIAHSYARDRIRANWVTVGWVATPGEVALRTAQHGNGEAFLSSKAIDTPFGRMETAEDIAAGVLYLVSDEASHVTGCELNISGGLWT